MPATLIIDPNEDDQFIPLEQVHLHIPGRPHRATIWRWLSRGLKRRGETIKLRSVAIGGRRFVHPDWITDFLAACNGETTTAARQSATRRKSHDVAAARLDALFAK